MNDAPTITVLTRFAKPGRPLKSFEGKVGALFPGEILVTSPNSSVIYRPPLNLCRVRLRAGRHFGPDDPLYSPQPFVQAIGHLSVIRSPSSDPAHPLALAWLQPSSDHFVLNDHPGSVCKGLGTLSRELFDRFQETCQAAISEIPKSNADSYLVDYPTHLQRCLDRLESIPACREDVFLLFAYAQRLLLEMVARNEWTVLHRGRLDAARQRMKQGPVLDVIGAFTEDMNVADILFYAGIPVWYVRPAATTPDVRIDAIGRVIEVTLMNTLELLHGGNLDVSDASPAPHRILYTGLANKPERYQAMNQYFRSLFQSPLLLGAYQPSNASVLPSSSVIRTSHGRSSHQPSPYSRKAAHKAYSHSKGDGRANNPFVDPQSPLLPDSVPAWERALTSLSHLNTSEVPEDGIHSGSFFPPPRLLVNQKQDDMKAGFICSWLKLRPLFLFAITSSPVRSANNKEWKPVQLTNKRWRDMLDVGQGIRMTESMSAGKKHKEMAKLLERTISDTGLQLDLGNLSVTWQDQTLPDRTIPTVDICRHMFWEIYELGFRQEIIMLDGQLDQSFMPPLQREDLLRACWSSEVADPRHAQHGLGSAEVALRWPFVCALHKLMSTWRGEKPAELLDPLPDASDAHNAKQVMERIERALAYFYAESFFDVFKRPPFVPHQPPRVS